MSVSLSVRRISAQLFYFGGNSEDNFRSYLLVTVGQWLVLTFTNSVVGEKVDDCHPTAKSQADAFCFGQNNTWNARRRIRTSTLAEIAGFPNFMTAFHRELSFYRKKEWKKRKEKCVIEFLFYGQFFFSDDLVCKRTLTGEVMLQLRSAYFTAIIRNLIFLQRCFC